MLHRASLLLSVFAVIGSPLVANAQTPAFSFTGGSGQHFPGYTVGWTFTVTNSVSVTSLGWFDFGSDGLLNNHEVGIFTLPGAGIGTLLTSTTVSTTDALNNGFRYKSIAPFSLAAGNYLVAGTSGDDLFQAFSSSVTTDASITFGQGRFIGPGISSLTFPTRPSDRGLAYFGPNFLIGATSVPEPGAFALLTGSAFVGGSLLLRRRRK